MKIHKISIVGIALGLLWGGANFWKYYVISLDTSEMLRGVLEGVIICGLSYIYNWMRNQEELNDEFKDKFNGYEKIVFKEEFGK